MKIFFFDRKLPNPFKAEKKIEQEAAAKHNGRVRSFPHERGIWATYVYIQRNLKNDHS